MAKKVPRAVVFSFGKKGNKIVKGVIEMNCHPQIIGSGKFDALGQYFYKQIDDAMKAGYHVTICETEPDTVSSF